MTVSKSSLPTGDDYLEAPTVSLRGRLENAVALAARSAEVASEFLSKADAAIEPHQQAFYRGMAAYEAKDFDSAREYLLESYALEPAYGTAARLAMIGYRKQDWYFAEEWISKAIAEAPDGIITAHVLRFDMAYKSVFALVQAHLGRVDVAVEEATAVINSRPDVMAYRARSTALLVQGDVDGAIADLHRARAIAPPTLINELVTDVDLLERARAAELSNMPVVGEMTIGMWPV